MRRSPFKSRNLKRSKFSKGNYIMDIWYKINEKVQEHLLQIEKPIATQKSLIFYGWLAFGCAGMAGAIVSLTKSTSTMESITNIVGMLAVYFFFFFFPLKMIKAVRRRIICLKNNQVYKANAVIVEKETALRKKRVDYEKRTRQYSYKREWYVTVKYEDGAQQKILTTRNVFDQLADGDSVLVYRFGKNEAKVIEYRVEYASSKTVDLV